MAGIIIHRTAIWAILALLSFLYVLPTRLFPLYPHSRSKFPEIIAQSLGTYSETSIHNNLHNAPAAASPADIYFDQAFALTTPREAYTFPALRKQCAHTKWRKDNGTVVYLRCEGIYLGLTSVMSQVKSCLKMALEAGTGVILPDIPLRAADNLLAYNQGNHDAERPFGAWFDQGHLLASMQAACPGLDIIGPRDVAEGRVRVMEEWGVDIHAARYFRERDGYFWAGKPFSAFFEENLARLREEAKDEEVEQPEEVAEEGSEEGSEAGSEEGSEGLHNQLARRTATDTTAATIIGMRADFELFSVTSDPTGHDRLLWDDLGRTLRFLEEPRTIVDKMLRQLGTGNNEPPVFFAVHFRGEGDNMWADPEDQMRVDLDALDAAWELYRHDAGVAREGEDGVMLKPPVYLACGDEASLVSFVAAGAERGWNVTSKYALAKSMETTETFDMIEELPFDFQAIIDLGLLVKSYFFIGLMGSAFSYTAANLRDPTTRYRGSSFEVWDDGGARTHLFPNIDRYGDTTMEKYACCL